LRNDQLRRLVVEGDQQVREPVGSAWMGHGKSDTVRDWDAEHLVLAPRTAAEYRLARGHKRDLERFLVRLGHVRCVVEIHPPGSTRERQVYHAGGAAPPQPGGVP
jgi:hypothetical protein